jgi:hypothetical protein
MLSETPSPSQTHSDSPSNGHIEGEGETSLPPPPDPPKKEYKLEDFSQQAINRGQQQINGLIREADERVVYAFNEVRSLIAILSANGKVDLQKLDTAISKLKQATYDIAGPFPPGCGTYPINPGPEES